tara:strand:+ start:145 stop:351 length:207 start_codon:yes stop_codon:yes gene_type:complete
MHPKPLQDIVDDYKKREADAVLNKMKDKKKKERQTFIDKVMPKQEITNSPTRHSKERAFSNTNIKHKW